MEMRIPVGEEEWELGRFARAAKLLEEMVSAIGEEEEEEKPRPSPSRHSFRSFFPIPMEVEREDIAPPSTSRHTLPWQPPMAAKPNEHATSRIPWMEMEMQTPHLKVPKWAKGAGCADSGSIFRAPHRLHTDGRIFRMNRAKRQGSVLVDTSGSMHFGQEDIEKIVQSIPAAVIATYGGFESERGGLRILAKGGRVAEDKLHYLPVGGMNGVDGPALRWLGAQPLPRIWICDGIVTGVGDDSTRELNQIAAGICERYRIRRVKKIEQVLRFL